MGVLIQLPELDEEQRADLESRRWSPEYKVYEKFQYKCPEDGPMPKTEGSKIAYFKNGMYLGTTFTDLYLGSCAFCLKAGKYYPAVSCYNGGKVKANFGPSFIYQPPAVWGENGSIVRPFSELNKKSKESDNSSAMDADEILEALGSEEFEEFNDDFALAENEYNDNFM